MISPGAKKLMMGGLVAAFAVQTSLVYSDTSETELSEEGHQGYVLWHEHNCQSCHQIYGYGGFLGPDLTNLASRLGPGLDGRVEYALREGPRQMPAFEMETEEVQAMATFFRELDQTGYGQARVPSSGADGDPYAAFNAAVEERLSAATGTEDARSGFELLAARPCAGCHAPLRDSAIGAPDLSTVTTRLDHEQLDEVLREGRPPRMPTPAPALGDGEREQVIAYFGWLAQERRELAARVAELTTQPELEWSELPWWEYK